MDDELTGRDHLIIAQAPFVASHSLRAPVNSPLVDLGPFWRSPQHPGDNMFQNAFAIAGLSLLSTALVTIAMSAPLPTQSGEFGSSVIVKVGEREKAAAAGAIMGGAVGVMLGSALARPAPPPVVYAPPAEVEEEVEPDEVIVRKRPARRVVEIEEDEDVAPRVVQEEECVTRRTKVVDPRSGQTVIRRERDCR